MRFGYVVINTKRLHAQNSVFWQSCKSCRDQSLEIQPSFKKRMFQVSGTFQAGSLTHLTRCVRSQPGCWHCQDTLTGKRTSLQALGISAVVMGSSRCLQYLTHSSSNTEWHFITYFYFEYILLYLLHNTWWIIDMHKFNQWAEALQVNSCYQDGWSAFCESNNLVLM